MAKIPQGIFGRFTGRIGSLIGSSWNGIPYVRSMPKKKQNDNPTPKQLAQRKKFTLVSQFLRPMKELMTITFHDRHKKATGMNNAISYNLKNAIVGEYPNSRIDYSRIEIARGALPYPLYGAAVAIEKQILFTWEDNSRIGVARSEDLAILVAYHAASNDAWYSMGNSTRVDGSGVLAIPKLAAGDELETWIAFISPNKQEISSSVYTGLQRLE